MIGAGLAYYGTLQNLQMTAVQSSRTLQQTEEQSRRTIQTSRDLLISQQISKGFEDLGRSGEDELLIRLGGIYALEGVMNASERYHQPVLEALSAFVRVRTGSATGDEPPATDIQAALTVIARRAAIGTGVPDLINAHIPRVRLGRADLVEAKLLGANLSNAILIAARLTAADLSKINLSKATLFCADLRHAILTDANLSGAVFGARDPSGNLLFAGTDLSGANLSNANLSDAALIGAKLRDAILIGANLSGADLSDADLSDASVRQEQLDRACGTERTKLPVDLRLRPCNATPEVDPERGTAGAAS